jgi:hypothetical protein
MFVKSTLLSLASLSLMASFATAQVPKSDQLPGAAPASQGRYQIIMSPHNARDTFLIDTETGRTWQLTVFSFLNDDPVVWSAIPRIDNDDDRAKIVADYGKKSRPTPAAR